MTIPGHLTLDRHQFTTPASRFWGEVKRGDAEKTKTSKADIMAALKGSSDYCDGVYNSMTDTDGAQIVKMFGQDHTKLGALFMNNAHNNEMYGTMSVYMRLKGIVPPSSERPMGDASKSGKKKM